MAFAIPRIQYRNVDTTGDTTSGNGTILDIADTSDIEIGMFVRGTGVPTGATVGSKATNSVTLASAGLCTATGGNVTLAFGWEILFDYPPVEPTGKLYETSSTVSESLSGRRQVSVNNTEEKRKLKFSFLSPAVFALMENFLEDSALLGESFRYYPDKTSSTYTEYELDSLKVDTKKIAPRGVDTYVWEVPLSFRRVL